MLFREISPWLARTAERKAVLNSLTQPMTPNQCAHRSTLSLDTCKYTLRQF